MSIQPQAMLIFQTQMSGLQGIQNMFGGLNLGQTDGLSGLLSVVSKLGPMTNDRQKSHNLAVSQKDQCDQSISPPFSSGRLNSDIKPLENLARSLSQGEDQSQFEGQDGDMMYKMLQNICGSVSKMRDVKVRQDEKTTQDDVHFQQRTENRFVNIHTVQILCIGTDRSQQTVQTKIRLLLKKQSDQGLRCLSFRQHLLDALMHCYVKLFYF